MADRPCMPSGMLAASQADRAREQTSQMHQKGDFQGGRRFLRPLAGQEGYGLRTSMSEK